jgi:long-chain acyl-CoA synthetase
MAALGDPQEWTLDAHGTVPSCIEVKLVDFPDAGYCVTNVPNPQGEIWIRGPSVMECYYENEAETAKAIAPGGWFQTGDIGEWNKTGHLKVIDRKKNLVKTLNGEYIALEKVSSASTQVWNHANDSSLNPSIVQQRSSQTYACTLLLPRLTLLP